MGIEAAIEAYHQRHPAFGDDCKARFGAPPVEVERLLAKDGLAGARCRFDQIGVSICRAGDDDGVGRRVGKDRSLRRDRRAVAARQPFRGGAIDIDDRAKARSGMANDILGVDSPDATRAELAEADHVRGFQLLFLK
jgi:hypothetical protein